MRRFSSQSSFSLWRRRVSLLGAALLGAGLSMVTAQAAGPGAQFYNEYLEKDLIYPDEEWQDYVTEIGERLLAVSPHAGKTYTFVVTDEPIYNAYATPDAYVFITRGIVAYFQSEAELAGVIGHEIGHVVGKHGQRRQRTSRIGQLLSYLGYFGTNSGSMFGLSRNLTGVLLAGYSREHELEADEYGTSFLIGAGYNPQGLLDSMGGRMGYENFERTVKNRPTVYHGITGSHPATQKRLWELIQQSHHLVPTSLPETERDFWQMIDGMTYGDEAATGVVKDGVYYHGALRLAIEFPDGWDVRSNASEVFGVPPKGMVAKLAVKRQAPPDEVQTPLEYLTETLRRDDLENGEEIQVGPFDGYLADIKDASGTLSVRKIALVYFNGGVYLFNGEAGPNEDVAAFNKKFKDTVMSMRPMTGEDLREVNTQKIKVIYAKPGDTYADLARGVPIKSYPVETLRLLNGHFPRGEPRAGDPIKIIE